MAKIITIGREFGSGGRELGRRLAETLQIAYYDKEIITEIAKRTSFSEQYVQQILEHRPVPLFPITTGRTITPMENPMMEQSQAIFREQSNIIKEMAAGSNCVIVGRCADYILKEQNPFRIFVYADMESKINRCREKSPEHEHLTDKELKQQIAKVNKGRARYYEFYTGQSWGDKLNYDICINTTRTVIKDVVPVLARMFL